MCKFCERNTNIKFGWDQPRLENIYGNIVEDLELKAVIHDYKTANPELIITSDKFFPDILGTDGIATIHINIEYCPVCGRKLGENLKKDYTIKKYCGNCKYYDDWFGYCFAEEDIGKNPMNHNFRNDNFSKRGGLCDLFNKRD